jgi:hypothetical protein
MAVLVTTIHAVPLRKSFEVRIGCSAWMPGTMGERSDAVLRTALAGHDA